jgi:homogentisate 1,2-dioxygenase
MSRCVWALADPTVVEHISLTTEPSAKQWLFSMINSMKHEEFTRMVVTMWAIWHARRKFIHEEIHQSPLATHQFVERFVHDMGVAQPVTKKEGTVARMSKRAPRWSPPPEGVCKINADGAVAKVSNKGALGVVCRSHEGL